MSGRFGSAAAVTIAIAQLVVVAIYAEAMQPLTVLGLKQSDTEYLAIHRTAYSQIRFADSTLPPKSLTLVLGTQELFWFSRDVRGGGNFDGARIAAYLSAPSPDSLLQRLKRDRITHLVVLADGIRIGRPSSDVKRRERELVLSPALAQLLQRFLREKTTLLARDRNTTVHQLAP